MSSLNAYAEKEIADKDLDKIVREKKILRQNQNVDPNVIDIDNESDDKIDFITGQFKYGRPHEKETIELDLAQSGYMHLVKNTTFLPGDYVSKNRIPGYHTESTNTTPSKQGTPDVKIIKSNAVTAQRLRN